jgi:excinuclease ABC subunit A
LSHQTIRLRNVRVNNLKSISLEIPHGQWLSLCGVSGSGKSSLAFDALYAEGQRRYLDCLSPATRRFLTKLDRPDADLIDGLPPSIAIRSSRSVPARSSTVGNATELVEHLRLLFSQIAKIVCPACNCPIETSNPEFVASWMTQQPSGSRMIIGFESISADSVDLRKQIDLARRNGFIRAIFGQQMMELERLGTQPTDRANAAELDASSEQDLGPLLVIVDRLTASILDLSRTRESLETAFHFGQGQCIVLVENDSREQLETERFDRNEGTAHLRKTRVIDGRHFEEYPFCTKPICPSCQRSFPAPEPRLFNFNSPRYACPECQGVGYSDSDFQKVCSTCRGSRLPLDALSFQVRGNSISDLCQLTIERLSQFFQGLTLSSSESLRVCALIPQITSRLAYLQSVGLGYLSLDRPLQSVSTGEAQRLQFTACLSATLVNMLYVLDEPSHGLHQHDISKLVAAIEQLHQRPNTVVVVDHHPEIIRRAGRVVEIGPAAGDGGGEIVFDGTVSSLMIADTSTGHFLGGRCGLKFETRTRIHRGKRVQLFGANGHNLKSINVDFPLGGLCVVTGVSGAGKSSLVTQTLYPALRQKLKLDVNCACLPYSELLGHENLADVVLIDQTPIGRSGRSNPVIYVKAFDEIRQAFSETEDAKEQGATPGHFSFNVEGGRCEKCQGDGFLHYDMQFLADVFVKCDECQGTRFRASTLRMRYRGLNIAEVLNLTSREAFSFFRGQPKVQAKLKALIDVGLDYVRLGQPANTLSGGECQRLKLAVYLNAAKQKRTLFVIEEPTLGLHPADVTRLLDGFDSLIGTGHSFVIVEHNLQLIQNADWIIDLGPGAAELGGQVVAAGTPETIAVNANSITGKFLLK